jgi:NAD(P)-dependent dehydrogenase (short-subunit alcohol dehydrogenase family)
MARPVVLITGASRGIGAAIAVEFARGIRGARLALVARTERGLDAVARRCRKLGAVAAVFPCDVASESRVAALGAAVRRRFGTVDVLVNNAGEFLAAPYDKLAAADFDRIVAANLRSVFLVCREFAPAMARRGRGDIFNMSSVAGRAAYRGGAAYCAAKFGVAGLSAVLRAELKDRGVRVCCVYPGATVSPSWRGSGVASRRMMPARDVARCFFGAWRLGRRAVVEEIVLRPQLGDV